MFWADPQFRTPQAAALLCEQPPAPPVPPGPAAPPAPPPAPAPPTVPPLPPKRAAGCPARTTDGAAAPAARAGDSRRRLQPRRRCRPARPRPRRHQFRFARRPRRRPLCRRRCQRRRPLHRGRHLRLLFPNLRRILRHRPRPPVPPAPPLPPVAPPPAPVDPPVPPLLASRTRCTARAPATSCAPVADGNAGRMRNHQDRHDRARFLRLDVAGDRAPGGNLARTINHLRGDRDRPRPTSGQVEARLVGVGRVEPGVRKVRLSRGSRRFRRRGAQPQDDAFEAPVAGDVDLEERSLAASHGAHRSDGDRQQACPVDGGRSHGGSDST